MRGKKICFVSFELAPFTGGGIGTWLGNTLEAYKDGQAELNVLFCNAKSINSKVFNEIYEGCTLYQVNPENYRDVSDIYENLTRGDFSSSLQWQSYVVMKKLLELEASGIMFDFIEFVDWCGIGFYTINKKRISNYFQNTTLTIRLHSTEGILRNFEGRDGNENNLLILDLEYQSLLYSDMRVAHIKGVADYFKGFYGFSDDWRKNCIVQLPYVKTCKNTVKITDFNENTPIVFTSKIQSFKRPDIFSLGCAEFIASEQSYNGIVKFLAFNVDDYLRDKCMSSFRDGASIEFCGLVKSDEREEVISNSVAVFPGVFEAFCFAAYEASMVGALVILNENNPAFGEDTLWIDGMNCVKFDGTSFGLKAALQKVYKNSSLISSLKPVVVEYEKKPYWEEVYVTKNIKSKNRKKLSLLCYNKNNSNVFIENIDSLHEQIDETINEIVAVNQFPNDFKNNQIMKTIKNFYSTDSDRLKYIETATYSTTASMIDIGIRNCTGDIIAIIPQGYNLTTDAIKNSVEVFENNNAIDIFIPAVAIYNDEAHMNYQRTWCSVGNAPSLSLYDNKVNYGFFFIKSNLLRALKFDESLSSEWAYDLTLRAISAGANIAISTKPYANVYINFFYDQLAFNEHIRNIDRERIKSKIIAKIGQPNVIFSSVNDAFSSHNSQSIISNSFQQCESAHDVIESYIPGMHGFVSDIKDKINLQNNSIRIDINEIRHAINAILEENRAYKNSNVIRTINKIADFTGYNFLKKRIRKSN